MVTPAWTGNLCWRLGAVTLASAPQKALDPQAAGWAIDDPVSCHMPELNTTSRGLPLNFSRSTSLLGIRGAGPLANLE